jgi:hypothetical protein
MPFAPVDFMSEIFANALRNRNQEHHSEGAWTLPGNPLKIDIHAQRVASDQDGMIQRLNVRIGDDGVRLLSVERLEAGEAKPAFEASGYPLKPQLGSMMPGEFSLDFRLPTTCALEDNRRPVRVKIRYERIGEKHKRPVDEVLDLDLACLIGDSIKFSEREKSLASLSSAYIQDPALQALIAKAKPLPRLSAYQELSRLGGWIAHLYVSDPGQSISSIIDDGEFYAFSPSETLRYGGDCEDWAILASGYLAALGYHSYIHYQFGHVFSSAGFLRSEWVFAGDPNQFQSEPVDFTEGTHAPLWVGRKWKTNAGYLPKNSRRAWVHPDSENGESIP